LAISLIRKQWLFPSLTNLLFIARIKTAADQQRKLEAKDEPQTWNVTLSGEHAFQRR
jgi:hypothetical protein